MKNFKIILMMISLLGLGLISCGPKGNEPNIELIQDMMVQEAIKAQRYDEYFKNGISQQLPPEHTQPIGMKPYSYGFNADLAEKELKNPINNQMDPEVLMTGQKQYETHCTVCHGQSGKGDGPIKAKYPIPIPPLNSDKVKKWTDARIFHTITVGQGLMGPYASHVPQQYRWQLVNYVRYLQKNQQ